MKAQFETYFENEYVKSERATVRVEVVSAVAHDMRRARGLANSFDMWNGYHPELMPLMPGEQFDAVVVRVTSKVDGSICWEVIITPDDKRNPFRLSIDESKKYLKSI